MHCRSRTLVSACLATALAGGALGAALPAAAQQAPPPDVTPARVGGENRIETAAAVARLLYPDGTDSAVLAAADDFPDALAGAPLASARNAPVLLTEQDQLSPGTVQALQDLGVSTVTILGGEAAVTLEVAQDLQQRGYQVRRVFGADRFSTAAEVAREVDAAGSGAGNFPGGQKAVFIANGLRFPDALAASAPAAAGPAQIPILLVTQDGVPPATGSALQDLGVDLAVIVGGEQAVSEEVRRALEAAGITVDRVAGPTRTATATAVAAFAQEFLDFDAQNFLLARGDLFPDALAAGPLGGAARDPILLSRDANDLGEQTAAYLAAQCPAVQVVRAVGGQAAITTSTLEAAETAAESCTPQDGGQTGQTFLVAPQEPLSGQPGDTLVFTVASRYDDQPFEGPVDVALFPCEGVDVLGSGPDTFADADGDGAADGFGETDTGATQIVRVNGVANEGSPRVLRDAPVDEDGDLDLALRADTADCTTLVVFEDVDDDDALDVDDAGVPTEPYGVGRATFGAA